MPVSARQSDCLAYGGRQKVPLRRRASTGSASRPSEPGRRHREREAAGSAPRCDRARRGRTSHRCGKRSCHDRQASVDRERVHAIGGRARREAPRPERTDDRRRRESQHIPAASATTSANFLAAPARRGKRGSTLTVNRQAASTASAFKTRAKAAKVAPPSARWCVVALRTVASAASAGNDMQSQTPKRPERRSGARLAMAERSAR